MTFDPEGSRWIPARAVIAFDTVSHTYRTGAGYLVAALSYYALTALMPLVLLTFVVIASVGEVGAARAAVLRFGDLLTPRGQAFVLASVEDVARRTGITAFAAAIAGASAVQLLRTLDRVMALVYEVESKDAVSQLRAGVVVFPVATLAGIGAVTNVAVLTAYATTFQYRMAAPSVVFLASAITLFAVYVTVPNVAVSAREALPGTLMAASAWAVSGTVAGTYAAESDGAALYGVLGGFLLVITWIYVANFALVVGASINAVLAGHVDPAPKPDDDGRPRKLDGERGPEGPDDEGRSGKPDDDGGPRASDDDGEPRER